MMTTFDALPNEIQQLVFTNVVECIYDIKECALVCRSWRSLCQRLLFSCVDIYQYSSLEIFVDALKKNMHLRGVVKELGLHFKVEYYNNHKYRNGDESSIIAELFTYLFNLKYIECSFGISYRFLLDALLLNQLPCLIYIEAPDNREDVDDFITCALLASSRLESLKVSALFHDWNSVIFSHTIREENSTQFFRLFNLLSQFQNLTELFIEKKCSNKIGLIEHAIRLCPSLQLLKISIYPVHGNRTSVVDISSVPTSIISATYGVSQLKIYDNALPDSRLIHYIISKFPRLKKLVIGGQKTSTLDSYTFNEFLKYLLIIKTVTIYGISWNVQTLIGFFAPLWKAVASQSYKLSIEFNYGESNSFTEDTVQLEIKDKSCLNTIYYNASYYHLQHASVIENYGAYIDCLMLSGIKWNNNKVPRPPKSTPFETLVLHPLQNCVNLQQLSIRFSNLTSASISNVELGPKQALQSLTITGCTMEPLSFFACLTNLISSINYLKIYNPKNLGGAFDDISVSRNTTCLRQLSAPYHYRLITRKWKHF